jgi:enoyl-CoA hydratase/carnithine racemase
MNALPFASHWEADQLIEWFDAEPSLRVAVITGAGDKAFCAGQDLIERGSANNKSVPRQMMQHPGTGFMGVSRRVGKKPIVAAVNGFALGGGFEIVLGWYVDPIFIVGKIARWNKTDESLPIVT